MRQVKRSALVAQSPARMFDLINDIESYPLFVPGCTHAHVRSRTEHEIVATLGVRRGALNTEFTTRNELEKDRRILMNLVSGPFKQLQGEWLLAPISTAGCRVELTVQFAFSNPLTGLLLEPLFESTIAALVDAFVARARSLPA